MSQWCRIKKEKIICPNCGEKKKIEIEVQVEDDGLDESSFAYLKFHCLKCKKDFTEI